MYQTFSLKKPSDIDAMGVAHGFAMKAFQDLNV
jgi:hypothetical protein